MKKAILLGIFILLLISLPTLGVDINLIDYYPIDSNNDRVANFSSDYIDIIEQVVLEYNIYDVNPIDSWYFNFTADGLDGCARGNLQDTQCYSYDDPTYKWIQFIDGEITETFDGTNFVQGDLIVVNKTENAPNNWTIELTIDEHYNPNIIKAYGDIFNFSDVAWQESYPINGDNLLSLSSNQSSSPFTVLPDLFKVAFRASYTKGSLTPTQPLEIYTCYNYTTGYPDELSSCALLCTVLPSEFVDDGNKVLCTGTTEYLATLGTIPDDLVLESHETNPSRYYYLKTYGVNNTSHSPNWAYSTNSGTSYTTPPLGYESDVNVNWFNDGLDPTSLRLSFWANSTNGDSFSKENNITWDIDPYKKYSPLLSIFGQDEMHMIHYYENELVEWNVYDVNNDELKITIKLDGVILTDTLNENDTSYSIISPSVGNHVVTVIVEKVIDSSYFEIGTHYFEVLYPNSGGSNPTYEKKDCNILIEPTLLKYFSKGIKSISITNNDIITYSPYFEIIGDLKPYLTITNKLELKSGETGELNILYNSENEIIDAISTIKFKSLNCQDKESYIKSSSIKKTTDIIESIIEKSTSLLKELKSPLSNREDSIFYKIPIWIILSTYILLFLVAFSKPFKEYKNNKKVLPIIILIITSLILAFILFIFTITYIRSI